MKIVPVINLKNNIYKPSVISFKNDKIDSFEFQNANFDKNVLISRGIISKDEDLNAFFNKTAYSIFNYDKEKLNLFSSYLKQGKISLSSNAYKNLSDPSSALAVKLNPLNLFIQNCFYLDRYIKKGKGIGINFSKFDNPSSEVKKFNSYFKFRESSSFRPASGIALLDIYNKDILNFITLKDNACYKDWCFDLSVIIDDKFLSLVDGNKDVVLSDGNKINAKKIYDTLLNSMYKKGEPGIIFSSNKDYICDCCAAAQLKEGEFLTLAQINLSKFVKDNKFDFEDLSKASLILNEAIKKLDKNAYVSILGYQDMLDKMNLKYGSNESLDLLKTIIKTIKSNNIKMAISPSGTISRFLKTTPSIEENTKVNYIDKINTLSLIQNLIEGQISNTIKLDQNSTISDVDKIIRYSNKKGLKGISVFRI